MPSLGARIEQLVTLSGSYVLHRPAMAVVGAAPLFAFAAIARPETWYETAIDADGLIDILAVYRARAAGNHVLVCHGHRHIRTAGLAGGIPIVALPSTTLGDKPNGALDAVLRYAIAGLRADGSWGIAIREVSAR
jgi:hypothetical protein